MGLPTEYRLKMKDRLPGGTSTKIARKLGITRQAVSNYIYGDNSKNIEKAFIEEIKEYKKSVENIVNEFLSDKK